MAHHTRDPHDRRLHPHRLDQVVPALVALVDEALDEVDHRHHDNLEQIYFDFTLFIET